MSFVVAIGSDKSGFEAKKALIPFLKSEGFEVVDEGTFEDAICDYPLFAQKVSRDVILEEAKFGVLICGSGEGMAIAANKVPGIRCGIGYCDEVSILLREHNDANIIAFGAKYMTIEEIKRRTLLFLNSLFAGAHHTKRIKMIEEIESKTEV